MVTWKGYEWVAQTRGPSSPGIAAWDARNASIDQDGFLRLRLTNVGGTLVGSEMVSRRTGWGYGTYRTTIGSRLDTLGKNVVFGGLFTYDGAAGWGNREIDACESSAWGYDTVSVEHTYFQALNPDTPTMAARQAVGVTRTPLPSDSLYTHEMVWTPGQIKWTSWRADGSRLRTATITHGQVIVTPDGATRSVQVPIPGNEHVIFNLWVVSSSETGGPHSHTTTPALTEVIIRDFSFAPARAAAMVLDETVTENEAGQVVAHAQLKADYVARGRTPVIPDYTATTTSAEHRAIHNALHADHNAIGAATTLPQVTAGRLGHLSHHEALHKAYNLRQASAPTPDIT